MVKCQDMGSYSELRLGSFFLGSIKDDIDPGIMMLFRESDKIITKIDPQQLIDNGVDVDSKKENEVPYAVRYRCSVSVAKDRLDLIGFTHEVAAAGFNQGLKEKVSRYEEWDQSQGGNIFQEPLQILRTMNLDNWLATLEEIKRRDLQAISSDNPAREEYSDLLRYMLSPLGREWYGFPGIDYRHFTRLLLDICPETDDLEYDLTDLALGGWVEESADLVKYAEEIISHDFVAYSRRIVLTEGISDKQILESSLKLLYPHLSDYFRFMDFGEARVGGGAGVLANTVKAFSGAGILNRIVAIFDNDTAGEVAIQSMSKTRLPDNILVLKYPSIKLASSYPTIGPTGIVSMDVNGLAGGIELYLGEDILRDDDGNLTPVQWKGYDAGLGQYQGEILNKIDLQVKFEQKIKDCEADPTQVARYDWTGLKAIIDLMRSAFHHQDAAIILNEEVRNK